MTYTLTADGDTNVLIPQGHTFSADVSGTFDSATIEVQRAITAPVAATLTTSLSGDDNDLVFTAKKAGADGNDITIEYAANPGVPTTSATCDNGTIVVNLATADDVAASLTTSLTGEDNDLILEAVTPGTGGNSITLALVDPGGNDQALAVTVTSNDIVVDLATNGSGDITTTAHQLKLALEADNDAADLVNVFFPSGTAGSGVVTALSETSLADGANGEATITTTADDVVAAIEANPGASALVSVANAAANDGSGTVTAMAETNLASGTNGTFEVFSSGTTGTFTATREAVFENTGASDYINLNVSSAGGSTSIAVEVLDLGGK